MVQLTFIARVIDGLPLAASMDENQDLAEYKNQAKLLLKKISESPHTRSSVDPKGASIFYYIIEDGVCYLTLCDKSYSKKLAFAYLEELQKEFVQQHGQEVMSAGRPYALIKFDVTIQKLKRKYLDSRSAQTHLSKIGEDLHDVQRIMMQNIDEVLGRGERIDTLASKAGNLSMNSKAYLKDAKHLNWLALMRKVGPVAAVSIVVLLVLYIRFF